jgi:hypothetical protein
MQRTLLIIAAATTCALAGCGKDGGGTAGAMTDAKTGAMNEMKK